MKVLPEMALEAQLGLKCHPQDMENRKPELLRDRGPVFLFLAGGHRVLSVYPRALLESFGKLLYN